MKFYTTICSGSLYGESIEHLSFGGFDHKFVMIFPCIDR